MKRVLFLSLLCVAGAAAAQQQERAYVAVYVYEQCTKDNVGQSIARKIREGVQRSRTMTVAESYAKSAIKISLVCLEPKADEAGSVSRYSYSITFMNHKGYYDYQLTHGVATCGRNRVNSCAEGLVADIDYEITKLKKMISEGRFQPL